MNKTCYKCVWDKRRHPSTKNQLLCDENRNKSFCNLFTMQPQYIEEEYLKIFNPSGKNKIYEHLFNSFRKFLDPEAKNTNENFELYYSLDQNKLLPIKISSKLHLPSSYIKIDFDYNKFKYLKSIIGYTFKNFELEGRVTTTDVGKDDTWKEYNNFILEILDNIYKYPKYIKINDRQGFGLF